MRIVTIDFTDKSTEGEFTVELKLEFSLDVIRTNLSKEVDGSGGCGFDGAQAPPGQGPHCFDRCCISSA